MSVRPFARSVIAAALVSLPLNLAGPGPAAGAQGDAASKRLQALERQIRGLEPQAVSQSSRRRLLKAAATVRRSLNKGDFCAAERQLTDRLRRALWRGKAFRRKAGKLRRRLGRRIDRIDGSLPECVIQARTAPPVEPRASGGPPLPIQQRPGEPAEEQEDEPLLIDPDARHFEGGGTELPISGSSRLLRSPADHPLFRGASEAFTADLRTDAGTPGYCATPQEPQAASARDVVVLSGNCGGFVSINGGQTFSPLNPATVFGSVDAGYCCDTVVRYAPQVDRFLWLLQGNCVPVGCRNSSSRARRNRYVLAVASPLAIRTAVESGNPAEDVWALYDLPSSLFGDRNFWFDFPDMQVGETRLYLTWNRLTACCNAGAIGARMRLDQIADGRTADILYWKQTTGPIFWRVAKGSGNFGLWVQRESDANAVLLYARDNSRELHQVDLSHTAVPSERMRSFTSQGENWMSRAGIAGTNQRSVALRGRELWLAWMAGRRYDGDRRDTFEQAHLQFAVYRLPIRNGRLGDVDDLDPEREFSLVNDSVALAFPALATNAEGQLAFAFSYGGAEQPPQPGAGFLTGPDVSGHPTFEAQSTTSALADTNQGDYHNLEVNFPDTTRFVTSGFVARGDTSAATTDYVFMRFGLGPSSEPPPPPPPPPPPGATSLSINCPNQVPFGATVNVFGELAPKKPGAAIRVVYERGDMSMVEHDTTTDLNSRYSDSLGFASPPKVVSQAFFDGDATHTASSSPECTTFVLPPPG